MRILVVSHWYLPRGNPCGLRWSALAEHWAAAGLEVDVVTAWVPGTPREETLRGVRVHRAGGALSARARSRYGNPAAHPGEPRPASRPGVAAAVLTWANARIWRNVWWPDYACLWRGPAVRAARRLLAAGDRDCLVSVSDPFTSHRVALEIARERPGLRWVADISDPFSLQETEPVNNPRLYRRLNRRAEACVLRRAEAATIMGAGLLAEYRAAFPEAAGKMHPVPLLLPGAAAPSGERFFPRGEKRRLVTVGTLHRRIREPGHLLALFARLAAADPGGRLELHFVGSTEDCAASFEPFRRLLGTRIFLHGVVPRERALAAMAEADCLVSLGNATANQVPSKLAEYAAAGRPLVNLVSSAQDSSAAFLEVHPAVLTLSRADPEGVEAQALRLARFIERPPAIDRERLDAWLEGFRVGPVAARYLELLRGAPGG